MCRKSGFMNGKCSAANGVRFAPVCAALLAAAVDAGEVRTDLSGLELMRGVGNLRTGTDTDPDHAPRRLVAPLIAGLRRVD